MLYGARYEAHVADRFGGATRVRAGGQALRVGRRDRARRAARRPAPGDVIVTPATGAYGYAMANNYNGVPRPPVIFCRDGDARVVVRRESFEDLTARDVASLRRAPGFPHRPARPRHRRRRRSPTLLDERAAEIERFNGRRPVITGVLTRTRGDFEEILAGCGPARRGDGRPGTGARVPAGGDARRQARRDREQAAALPARRGAVRDGARARRAGCASRPRWRAPCRSCACSRNRCRRRRSSASTGSSTARPTSSSREMARGCDLRRGARRGAAPRLRRGRPDRRRLGRDAAAKMAILARLAFGSPVHLDDVRYEGIEHLHGDDLEYARELGLGLKLVGTAERREGGLSVHVHPDVPLLRASARVDLRAVQRGHGRVRDDHRDDAVRARRRRPADGERGARRRGQRDDRRRAPAGAAARAAPDRRTSRAPSTCTSTSPTAGRARAR